MSQKNLCCHIYFLNLIEKILKTSRLNDESTKFEIKYFAARIEMDEYLDLDSAKISKDPLMSRELSHTFRIKKNRKFKAPEN